MWETEKRRVEASLNSAWLGQREREREREREKVIILSVSFKIRPADETTDDLGYI